MNKNEAYNFQERSWLINCGPGHRNGLRCLPMRSQLEPLLAVGLSPTQADDPGKTTSTYVSGNKYTDIGPSCGPWNCLWMQCSPSVVGKLLEVSPPKFVWLDSERFKCAPFVPIADQECIDNTGALRRHFHLHLWSYLKGSILAITLLSAAIHGLLARQGPGQGNSLPYPQSSWNIHGSNFLIALLQPRL